MFILSRLASPLRPGLVSLPIGPCLSFYGKSFWNIWDLSFQWSLVTLDFPVMNWQIRSSRQEQPSPLPMFLTRWLQSLQRLGTLAPSLTIPCKNSTETLQSIQGLDQRSKMPSLSYSFICQGTCHHQSNHSKVEAKTSKLVRRLISTLTLSNTSSREAVNNIFVF